MKMQLVLFLMIGVIFSFGNTQAEENTAVADNWAKASKEMQVAVNNIKIAWKKFPKEEIKTTYKETGKISEKNRKLCRHIGSLGRILLDKETALIQAVIKYNEATLAEANVEGLIKKMEDLEAMNSRTIVLMNVVERYSKLGGSVAFFESL